MVSGPRSHEYKKGTWYLGKRTQKRNRQTEIGRFARVWFLQWHSSSAENRNPKPISKWISDSSSAHAIAHYIISSWLSPLISAFRLSLPPLSLPYFLSLKRRVLPFCQILRSPLLLGWADTLVRVSGFLSFLSSAVESDGRQGSIFQRISAFGFAFFWRFTVEGRRFYCLHGEFSLLGSVQSLVSFKILQLYLQKQRGNIFVFSHCCYFKENLLSVCGFIVFLPN